MSDTDHSPTNKRAKKKRPSQLQDVTPVASYERRAFTPGPGMERAWGTYDIADYKSKVISSIRSPSRSSTSMGGASFSSPSRRGSRAASSKSPTRPSPLRLRSASPPSRSTSDRFQDFYFKTMLKNSPGPVYTLPSSFNPKAGPTFGKPPANRERLQGFNRYLGPTQARIEHQGRASPGPTTKVPTSFGETPTTRFSSTPAPNGLKTVRAAKNAVSAVVRMQTLVNSMNSVARGPRSTTGVSATSEKSGSERLGPSSAPAGSVGSVEPHFEDPEHVEVVNF